MGNDVIASQSVHSPVIGIFSTAYNFSKSAAQRSEQKRLSTSSSLAIRSRQNSHKCKSRTNSALQWPLQKKSVSLPMRHTKSPKMSIRLRARHFAHFKPLSCISSMWSNRQFLLQKFIVCQRSTDSPAIIWRTHSVHFKRNDSRRTSKLMSVCSFDLIGILYFAGEGERKLIKKLRVRGKTPVNGPILNCDFQPLVHSWSLQFVFFYFHSPKVPVGWHSTWLLQKL